MTEHLLFIASAALFDGVSTSQQVIFLIMLFGSPKPIKNSVAYIAGIFIAYLVCGIIGLSFINDLNIWLKKFFPTLNNQTDPSYYKVQLVFGIVLVIAGIIYLTKKKTAINNRFLGILKKINPIAAFLFGAFISSTSFPTAIPYISSLEKINSSSVGILWQFLLLLIYNLIYALPMIIPFLIYLFMRTHSSEIEKQLHFHTHRINSFITIIMLAGMGLYFIADSIFFLIYSHPMINNNLFF